jgi:Protein of unknown function (DUF1153)
MPAIILCGPTGQLLPPIPCRRWSLRRKRQVVVAVRQGIVTVHEACCMWNLSVGELAAWARTLDIRGPHPLAKLATQTGPQPTDLRHQNIPASEMMPATPVSAPPTM